MRRLERLTTGLVAAALACSAAAADADALKPFEASYTWIWHGAPVAVSTLKFEPRQADTWSYASSSEPRGLGFLYPMRPRLESLMRIGEQGVQPLHYHAADGTSSEQRGADVTFDWDAGRATGVYKGVPVDLALKRGVQDDLSIQIALLYALRQGRVPANLSMIDKNSIRDYDLSAGTPGNHRHPARPDRYGGLRQPASGLPAHNALLVRAGQGVRADACAAEAHRQRRMDHGNRIAQAFGRVTPRCFWYLPPRSAYEVSQTSSDSKNSICATPSLA